MHRLRSSEQLCLVVCLLPKALRRVQRIHVEVLPPCEFVTALVELAMMEPAEGDGEFVTHLVPECPLFSKPKVMRIGWRATAGQTRLGGHDLRWFRSRILTGLLSGVTC
jgi:hypothetical protein